MRLFKALTIATALLTTSAPVYAQTAPHGIAAVVNSDIVTIHDLRQRQLRRFAIKSGPKSHGSVSSMAFTGRVFESQTHKLMRH